MVGDSSARFLKRSFATLVFRLLTKGFHCFAFTMRNFQEIVMSVIKHRS